MHKREKFESAYDAVASIPDEIDVSKKQIGAIGTVLQLLLKALSKLQGTVSARPKRPQP